MNLVLHVINIYSFFDNQPTAMKEIRRLLKDQLIPKFSDDIRDFLISSYIEAMNPSNIDQIQFLLNTLENYKKTKNNFDSNEEFMYTKDLKYETKLKILVSVFESNISLIEKKKYEDLIIKDDLAFINNKLYKYMCSAAIANRERKNLLWRSFVFKDSNLSLAESEAYMIGFMRKHQIIVRNIIKENFIEDFLYVKEFHGTEYALIFYKYLNPSIYLHDKVK